MSRDESIHSIENVAEAINRKTLQKASLFVANELQKVSEKVSIETKVPVKNEIKGKVIDHLVALEEGPSMEPSSLSSDCSMRGIEELGQNNNV